MPLNLSRYLTLFSFHYFLWFGALTYIYGFIDSYSQAYARTTAFDYGILNSILPFVTIITKLFFCSLADRHKAYRSFFIGFLITALIGYGSFAILPIFVEPKKEGSLDLRVWICICFMTSVATISMSVVASLSDAFAMNASKKYNISFGLIRVFGTIGWGISSLVLAFINQIEMLPYLVPGICVLIILITIDINLVIYWPNRDDFKLNKSISDNDNTKNCPQHHSGESATTTFPKPNECHTNYGTNQSAESPSRLPENRTKAHVSDLHVQWTLFKEVIRWRRSILRYMILFIISGALISLQWAFFFKYLENRFKNKFSVVTGLSMFGQSMLGELPFFILSKYVVRYLGRSHTLSLSIITIGLRYFLYDYLLGSSSYYYVLVTEPLAGPNFGLFYVVMTEVGLDYSECDEAIKRVTDEGLTENDAKTISDLRQSLRATMQSLMGACYEGLGVGIGSIVGGYVINKYGYSKLWFWSAFIAVSLGLINLSLDLLRINVFEDKSPSRDRIVA